MKMYVKANTEMTDEEIMDRISDDILKRITDFGVQTALRRILFYKENKIDWQDAWQQVVDQVPEIR